MKRNEVDRTKLSPMMLHYVELKDNYPDTIIFYRLGDFYEMFFEDAELISHELELTLTGRNAGLEERVPMCGIPYHAAEIYIDKIIKKGYKIAICEQLEDAKNTKTMVKRDITEVISSGSIISSNALNEKENNYIGSIYTMEYCYIITYADITTGDIFLESIEKDNNLLLNKILFLGIKELIINTKTNNEVINSLKNTYKLTITITDNIYDLDNYKHIYENIDNVIYINGIKHLINYLTNELKRNISHFKNIVIRKNNDYLIMDIHTKRNLELTESIRNKERIFSLLWLLDETKTAMGSRKLKSWIESPLTNKDLIEERYNTVSTLLE